MVLATLAGLIGIVIMLAGLALIAAHSFARDDDGHYTTDREALRTPSYAIVTGDIDLGTDPADWIPEELLANVRIRAEGEDGRPIFLGIGRDRDVDRYLAGVRHAELTDFVDGEPRYRPYPGGAPRRPPGAEDLWVAESQGPGEQVVDWDAESGVWSVLVMNADAAAGVAVQADAGAEIGWLIWAGIGLTVVGVLLTAAGVILIVVIGRRARGPITPEQPLAPPT
jgi:hypothetical protein